MKSFVYDILYFFLNHVVNHIPTWTVRKAIYCLCGLKIGRGSRINMGCMLMNPWGIKIGENTLINENCLLDGRGGLVLGDNCSVSMGCYIYSATHYLNSDSFEFRKRRTIIGNGVWIGSKAIINAGSCIENFCMIGTNSSTSSQEKYTEKGVYVGVPAKFLFNRDIKEVNVQFKYYFR